LVRRFEEHGWELLEKESLGVGYKYKAKCPCGEVRRKSIHSFKDGKRCRTCVNREKAEKRKMPWEQVINLFDSKGIKIKEGAKYINSKTPMDCICACGRSCLLSHEHVKKGGLCSGCAYERNGRMKYTWEEIDEVLSERGITLFIEGETYLKTSVDYVCYCGRKGRSTLSNLLRDGRCRNCINEENTGTNNANYDPSLTDEERENKRIDVVGFQWSKKIKDRDEYICQICEDNRDVVAHHIYSYKEHKDKRIDLNNGVTLCRECHSDFHRHYGYGNNNLDQFLTYLMIRWEDEHENTLIRH